MQKWHFIFNSEGWWLRIKTEQELQRYIAATSNEFDYAVKEITDHRIHNTMGHYTDYLVNVMDAQCDQTGKNPITVANDLLAEKHKTYAMLLRDNGRLNINRNGGCNSIDYPVILSDNRDTLNFPCFKQNKIVIKTWEFEDKKAGHFRTGYKYHYYAYIDGVQLCDGDKCKWDTYQEAYSFAKKFIQQ